GEGGGKGFVAGEAEDVGGQGSPPWLDLSAAPIHGTPSSCLLAIANVTEVAQILDRRRGLELAGLTELLFDAPKRASIRGRIEEGTLQRRHRPVDGSLAPTRHPGKGVLGRGAKSGARRW